MIYLNFLSKDFKRSFLLVVCSLFYSNSSSLGSSMYWRSFMPSMLDGLMSKKFWSSVSGPRLKSLRMKGNTCQSFNLALSNGWIYRPTSTPSVSSLIISFWSSLWWKINWLSSTFPSSTFVVSGFMRDFRLFLYFFEEAFEPLLIDLLNSSYSLIYIL